MEGRWLADEQCDTRCLSCIQEWRPRTKGDTLLASSVAPFWTTVTKVTKFMPVLGSEGGEGRTLVRRRARQKIGLVGVSKNGELEQIWARL